MQRSRSITTFFRAELQRVVAMSATSGSLTGVASLDKQQLVLLVERIAKRMPEARAMAVATVKQANGGVAGAGGELLVQALKAVLNKRINKAHKMAEDDDGQANGVLNVVNTLLKDKTFKCTGVARVRVLCELAQGLQRFDPERHICDFDGDEVLQAMENEMCALLAAPQPAQLPELHPLLGQVAKLFSMGAWKCFQDFGLFDKISLAAGDKARKLMSVLTAVDSMDIAGEEQRAGEGRAEPGGSEADCEQLVEDLRAVLKKRIKQGHKKAEERVGTKLHLIDEATPTVGVVQSLFNDEEYKCTGVARVRVLCELADGLQNFSPEGKIYDFHGDKLLQAMDDEMCTLLAAMAPGAPGLHPLLTQVVQRFSISHWKGFQDYGLFDGVKLSAGDKARGLMAAQPAAVGAAGSQGQGVAGKGPEVVILSSDDDEEEEDGPGEGSGQASDDDDDDDDDSSDGEGSGVESDIVSEEEQEEEEVVVPPAKRKATSSSSPKKPAGVLKRPKE